MFGYIKPLKCELKVREYDYYRAAYCGLCHTLRKRCGIKARFIVNYDFVFIGLLLSSAGKNDEKISKKRCLVCPKGRECIESSAYNTAADVSVILTYLKLCDSISDNGFWKGLFKGRLPKLLLRRAYKKARKAIPVYAERAESLYNALCELERNNSPSIDETADKFAGMLAEIPGGETKNDRILKEIFYHIGRFVYIIDALDDLPEDYEKGEYNPIVCRFNLKSAVLPDEAKERVLLTLEDSRQAILRAFELFDKSDSENLLRNIIDYGMNISVRNVLDKEKENERSI
ncbi:MAG: hypothetical protein E7473_03945 [Ruminococcaceae bacterium]|nr:hypothetical protein [Oscillospiraceae bacterium]